MEDVHIDGVDHFNRTVTLPQDVVEEMHVYDGLEDFFHTMSFSHKREYALAIAEAKKPATRKKRILDMIEMVLKLKQQKESKER